MKPGFGALIAVGLGGAIGSAARYALGTAVQTRAGMDFPVATLVINITGSLVLGFLMRYSLDTAVISPEMRLLLTTGVCGGFTTFSTFAYESVQLTERGEYGRAGLYVASSVTLSLLATLVGIAVARWVIASGRFHTTPS